mgnify:CR=1 FL=1
MTLTLKVVGLRKFIFDEGCQHYYRHKIIISLILLTKLCQRIADMLYFIKNIKKYAIQCFVMTSKLITLKMAMRN